MIYNLQLFGGRGAQAPKPIQQAQEELKENTKKSDSFNDFRFGDLNYRSQSNEYFTMDRVNKAEDKVVVRVSDNQIIETKFGYALILDNSHVVFVKDWAVSDNWFGTEVLLTKQYFNPKEWGQHEDFGENAGNMKWETWLQTAKEQQNLKDEDGYPANTVKWRKKLTSSERERKAEKAFRREMSGK